ncbi:MAG: hypothetical protein OXF67_06660 [Cyanobacteria bacterium MAG CAR4_bin_6]|nr:hypothetical protein [Cyanobacteria bacterium MAG CAR4_bin_6]
MGEQIQLGLPQIARMAFFSARQIGDGAILNAGVPLSGAIAGGFPLSRE